MGRKNEIIVTVAEHSLALQALVFKLADDQQRLADRIDENDAAIERLIEDFDEMDQQATGWAHSAEERLDVHNTFISDLGERLAAIELTAKRKGAK